MTPPLPPPQPPKRRTGLVVGLAVALAVAVALIVALLVTGDDDGDVTTGAGDGRSLGAALVSEGLAEPWRGKRSDWCTTLAGATAAG